MYDAKEKETIENGTIINNTSTSLTDGICISDRNYFNKVRSESLMNTKTGYVPRENLFD